MKKLIFSILILSQMIFADSFGLKLNLVIPSEYSSAIGLDGFYMMNINKKFPK